MKKMSFDDIFNDVTRLGTKIPKDRYLSEGAFPVIDQGQEFIAGYVNSETGIFNSVPVVVFGDHTRILKYIDFPFFLGADGVKVLTVNKLNCLPKYAYYALKSARIPDTGYNRHFKWLKEMEFTVIPRTEQEKIVKSLDSICHLITLKKKQLNKLDKLASSRFSEMFGRMPRNEKHWTVVTIRDVVTEVRYGSSRPAVENGQYPYLRMNNITYSGELDLSEIKRINVPDNELSKCTVRRGDVLFNRTNSKELVGKTCVYNRDEMMVLAGFVIRIRLDHEKMLPEFLSAFLNTDFSKQMLLNMCKTAIGQANINAQELQNISVFLPPLQLQKDFVAIKQQLDKSKVICNKMHKMVEFSLFRV